MALTLYDLLLPVTREEVEENILAIADTLGLPVTAWQPLGVGRTIIASVSDKIADLSTFISVIAGGGLLDYAAGDWLDLLAQSVYNVTRVPAAFATGNVTLTNASATPYPIAIGGLTFAHVTSGATYTNTTAFTVPASSSLSIPILASIAGASSSAGPATVTVMVTPIFGVTASNARTITGQDAEGDAELAARCKDKLGTLSPNGPKGAYAFFAKIQADGITPIATSVPITRVTVRSDALTGVVTTYIANAAGAVSATDVALVEENIQALAVPLSVTAVVASAAPVGIAVVGTIFVSSSVLTDAQIQTKIGDALGVYFAQIPIGGYAGAVPNQIFHSIIIGRVYAAVPETSNVTLATPSGDVTLSSNAVAVLTSCTFTVVRV